MENLLQKLIDFKNEVQKHHDFKEWTNRQSWPQMKSLMLNLQSYIVDYKKFACLNESDNENEPKNKNSDEQIFNEKQAFA